ncbi:hypothetical protein HNQ70_003898 [Quisquiliibacterium transsilvanicum]|uniref:Type II toxin-antitoxin system VapC family toxin n=1 Tax=Quisquiliibacterium transsilvanicum TaxID=1549638 RepID=A0A7W8MA98_9BURK|nr:hypothetical protein [Quisquiliibacterium transsilvanicum]
MPDRGHGAGAWEMTVVTRNVADFGGTGVALLDPWIFQAP